MEEFQPDEVSPEESGVYVSSAVWFTEMHRDNAGLSLKVKDFVHSEKSRYQKIEIIDTFEYGRVLVLYGSIMTTERDEFIYHEMISHVPLFSHPNPCEVCVIGGGDGGTVREVLRHQGVIRVTQIEIDERVIEVAKKYLPGTASGYGDKRWNLIVGDGAEELKNFSKTFDVVLIDASDPVGPAESIFTKEFYETVQGSLKDGGICALQSESPFYDQEIVKPLYKKLRGVFFSVEMYLAHIPCYPSGIWSFAYCTDAKERPKLRDEGRIENMDGSLRYYNREIHEAAFQLPNYVKEIIFE